MKTAEQVRREQTAIDNPDILNQVIEICNRKIEEQIKKSLIEEIRKTVWISYEEFKALQSYDRFFTTEAVNSLKTHFKGRGFYVAVSPHGLTISWETRIERWSFEIFFVCLIVVPSILLTALFLARHI